MSPMDPDPLPFAPESLVAESVTPRTEEAMRGSAPAAVAQLQQTLGPASATSWQVEGQHPQHQNPQLDAEATGENPVTEDSFSQTAAVAAARTPPATGEANFGGLMCMQSVCDGWDADSSQSFGVTSSKSYRQMQMNGSCRSSNMTCTRGPRGGITSISLGLSSASEPTGKATAHGSNGGNKGDIEFDNPSVIHGSRSWVPGEVLGHGSLGSVFKALDQATGQLFAVKEVRIDRKDETDVKFKNELENEIGICKELEHPHIVLYLGHDYINSRLYIYLEYMPGGSLAQVLSQFGPFDESLIATYARELLEGLEYLHTREPRVLHRDIKGANILVGLDCRVKLSDFGCSKRTADTMSQSLRGSIPWMAPEVIQQTGYGRRSDVWSLGCVIIEMATARHPWGTFDNPMAAMVKIGMSNSTPPIPDSVSESCRDLISQCTQRDKEKRPLAGSLLAHVFVRDAIAPAC